MNLSYGKVNKSRVSGVAIYAPGFYPPSELKPELRTGVYGFNKGVVAIRKRNPRSRVNKVKYGFVCKAVRFTPEPLFLLLACPLAFAFSCFFIVTLLYTH